MPMNKALYSPDWEAISKRIRFERAGNRCEVCGIRNGAQIIRSDIDPAYYIIFDEGLGGYRYMDGGAIRLSEIPAEYSGKEIRIVLTVAHLDHNPANNDDSNLKAMCQRCHLQYDGKQHAANARKTRLAKKRDKTAKDGQTSFW